MRYENEVALGGNDCGDDDVDDDGVETHRQLRQLLMRVIRQLRMKMSD